MNTIILVNIEIMIIGRRYEQRYEVFHEISNFKYQGRFTIINT